VRFAAGASAVCALPAQAMHAAQGQPGREGRGWCEHRQLEEEIDPPARSVHQVVGVFHLVGAVCGCGWSAVAAGERATLSSRQDFLPTMAPLQHGRRSPPRDWLMRKVSFLKLSSSGCIQAYIEKLSPPKVTE
jgi:hypothetical protein